MSTEARKQLFAVLIGDDQPQKPWWNFIVRGLVERWQVRENDYKGRFEDFVAQSAFSDIRHGVMESKETWGLEHILGKIYSVPGSKPELFGAKPGSLRERAAPSADAAGTAGALCLSQCL